MTNYNNPLISILTPTFNRPSWLKITLDSLVKQSYVNWECLVINDHGENVENIVNGFKDNRIKYYENDKNYDLAKSRNIAISKSSGDWYVMLDDDDILYRDALEYRLYLAQKNLANVVYTHALKMYYKVVDNAYQLFGTSLYWHSENIKDLILIQNCSPCNCLFWSREAQEKAGYFNEELKTSEDWAHSVEMRQHYEFIDSDIIDCACSWRQDNSQMTGSRSGFTDHLPYLYGKWRKYAENYEWVKDAQNRALVARGLNPSDYGL